jgi:hypothetical protein
LRDGNGRVARLARWLAQCPTSAGVDLLVLEHKQEGEWQRLQVWPRSEAQAALAQMIDSTIVELANELGAYVTARCAWFDSARQVYWTEHALRVQPEDLDVSQAFSGDQTSIAIQNQRHQERVVSVHLGGFADAMRALRESSADMRAMKDQAVAECVAVREENAQLRAENLKLETMLEKALLAAENAENDNGGDSQQKQVLQLVTTALAGHQAAAMQQQHSRPKG